ncbi:MAG: CHAP domain-containing protein [Flavisolibacter sp.]|nr:CHAP domain-containing protein [Flavisolibacter sp.]
MNYPNRVIKQGETNTTIVTAIQKRLIELGCGTFTTFGTYGPKTVAAVKLFQSMNRDDHGNPLEVDGKIGSISWVALFGIEEVPTSDKPDNDLLKETLKVARSQVGIMEVPPNSNRGPEVDSYLKCVNCPPGSYWCAAFVYWCFNEAAKKLERANPLYKTAGCLEHWNRSKAKKIAARDAVNNPSLVKPGQIFIMDHGGGFGHTGIVEKVEGGFIYTIEGNSNPSGSRNGIGVFPLIRKIAKINKGFLEYK